MMGLTRHIVAAPGPPALTSMVPNVCGFTVWLLCLAGVSLVGHNRSGSGSGRTWTGHSRGRGRNGRFYTFCHRSLFEDDQTNNEQHARTNGRNEAPIRGGGVRGCGRTRLALALRLAAKVAATQFGCRAKDGRPETAARVGLVVELVGQIVHTLLEKRPGVTPPGRVTTPNQSIQLFEPLNNASDRAGHGRSRLHLDDEVPGAVQLDR